MFLSIKEIESVFNNLSKQKVLDPHGFIGEFYQTFRKEIIPILYHLFQKTEAEGILPKLFCSEVLT